MQDDPKGDRLRWAKFDTNGEYVRRVLIFLVLAALAFLFWKLRQVFLLSFAAVLVAVLLLAAVRPVERGTRLSHKWSLAIVGLAILTGTGLLSWLVGAQAQFQISDLVGRVSQAWGELQERLGFSISLKEALGQDGEGSGQGGVVGVIASAAQAWAGQLLSYGYLLLEAVATFFLVVIGGVFLASNPELYRRGFIKIFPPSRHRQIEETLSDSGEALRLWLLAQLLSMTIIGVLTGLGTWAIGLPAPLALGLFAGLAEFVPIVGPIVSAIPALLLASSEGWTTVLWTLLLYTAIQQLESDVITPMVQQRMVSIPAGLLLLAVLAFGILFGVLGIVIASPLAVVTYVAVKKLYVRDVLEEETDIPGQK